MGGGRQVRQPEHEFPKYRILRKLRGVELNNIGKLAAKMGMDVRPFAWAFMFIGERCFEGTRTFTTQGIDKPVFNLFKMYSKMGSHLIGFSCSHNNNYLSEGSDSRISTVYETEPEVSGIASISDNRSIRIMVYNHHDDWDIEKELDIEIKIENVQKGNSLKLRHYRIDKTHSNAYAEWLRQDSPDDP